MNARPRALHVSPIMPASSGNGLAMRQAMFLEALQKTADTDLLVLPVFGDGPVDNSFPASLGCRTTVIPLGGRSDTHFQLLMRIKDRNERLQAFRAYGKSSLAAALSLSVMEEIRARFRLATFDIVHIGRSYLSESVVRDSVRAEVRTVDLDEDEESSFRQQAEAHGAAGDPDEAAWAEAEAAAFGKAIRTFAPWFKTHLVSSTVDAGSLASRHSGLNFRLVPNAVTVPTELARQDDGLTLLFVGSLGYWPNIDGLRWFLDGVWPEIAFRRPDVRLLVVGRGRDPEIERFSRVPGVTVMGDVDDIADAYARATIVIGPLRAGMGTRIKMIEAAAHAMPIVATPAAMQGLAFQDGIDARIAGDPASFARGLVELLAEPAEARAIGLRARSMVAARHQRPNIVAALSQDFASIINEYA